MQSLLSIQASNFLSLGNVDVSLQGLSVLVGPNGAGKSNLLTVIKFLGDTARLDLVPAIEENGGFNRLFFRGLASEKKPQTIKLGIKALLTKNASPTAPDEYSLTIWRQPLPMTKDKRLHHIIQRRESFVFKRVKGAGRRISVTGGRVDLVMEGMSVGKVEVAKKVELSSTSSGLSTLPRLKGSGAEEINSLAQLFTTFRVFEIDCNKARKPALYDKDSSQKLDSDAGNLAAFLLWLSDNHPKVFQLLEKDLRVIVPTIRKVNFVRLAGADDSSYAITFTEVGLKGDTSLSDASFGTVRALALLAMLHDPNPPRLTCVEEIDHGLHPHALDRIVERLRSAARRTQLLVVTHSPALANRLKPEELIVCERDLETGASVIPSVPSEDVAAMSAASELLLGELWFSGALGGGLD